ncbi:MAG: N-acetylglucosamine-6-phosphate deacetylase [Bacteroidetes bacterium]|nr:N-acetylglucosamine-6-phosphate deacetylase [Bacteroidota bacterium]
MTTWKIINGGLFTGDGWFDNAVIGTDNGRIVYLEMGDQADNILDLQGGNLVPAFIDIQLYGGNGLLFGEHPSQESLQATVDSARAGGASLILPTVATHTNEVVYEAIDAVRQYWAQGGRGVAGLHLEGPFLNKAKKGAHAENRIQAPTIEAIKNLVDYGRGVVKIMTIAPECFSPESLDYMQSKGILLSLGHSNASYEEAMLAFDRGIPLATHLYNAMSGLQHRAPGAVGAIFDHPRVMASIVADGYHVAAAAIRIAKKIMGDRLFLITDAVAQNAAGYYQHRLDGNRYVMPDGTLSGSALTMRKAVSYCVEQVGIEFGEALRMASMYPARALGISQQHGKIAPGYWSECAILYPDGSSTIKVL